MIDDSRLTGVVSLNEMISDPFKVVYSRGTGLHYAKERLLKSSPASWQHPHEGRCDIQEERI